MCTDLTLNMSAFLLNNPPSPALQVPGSPNHHVLLQWNKVNFFNKYCFISWSSNFSFTYLSNQISLRGCFVLKTSRSLPSFQPYTIHFCSFLNNGDLKQDLRGNFFWDTLYHVSYLPITCCTYCNYHISKMPFLSNYSLMPGTRSELYFCK